jgi:hypothetical protein
MRRVTFKECNIVHERGEEKRERLRERGEGEGGKEIYVGKG